MSRANRHGAVRKSIKMDLLQEAWDFLLKGLVPGRAIRKSITGARATSRDVNFRALVCGNFHFNDLVGRACSYVNGTTMVECTLHSFLTHFPAISMAAFSGFATTQAPQLVIH